MVNRLRRLDACGAAISDGHARSAMTRTLPTASKLATIAIEVTNNMSCSSQRGETPAICACSRSKAMAASSLAKAMLKLMAMTAAAASVQISRGTPSIHEPFAGTMRKSVSSAPKSTQPGSRSTWRAPSNSSSATPSAKNAVKTMPSAAPDSSLVRRRTQFAIRMVATPAMAAPTNIAMIEWRPATRNPATSPGNTACAIASPVMDSLRRTIQLPSVPQAISASSAATSTGKSKTRKLRIVPAARSFM